MGKGTGEMDAAKSVTVAQPRLDDAARRTRGIVAFLAIAFGLAWVPFAPVLLGLDAAGAILMPFAPAIAAFVVRKWVTREGFGDAGLRLNLRRWPFYLLAAAWPFAATPLSVLLALALRLGPEGLSLPWGLAAPAPRDLLV